jgi:DNA gyrase/topoisomerase IV subunit A
MSSVTPKTVTETIDVGYLAYAMYVLQSRAIPSVIDGLKPVTRKLLYFMVTQHKTNRVKVADMGCISSFNYHHGEASAIGAALSMSQKWNNNAPIFESHGNFGSRLVQEAAGPRYIYSSLSENYKKFFIDEVVAPISFDDKNPEPAYYLPIIPWVLVNGIGGMAVGFKTEILPRSLVDVLKCTKEYLKNPQKFLSEDKPIPPTFPNFSGSIVQKSVNQWKTIGIINYIGKYTYEISELPIGYDRATYVTLLNDLLEKDLIREYDDNCSKAGFGFKVKVSVSQKSIIDKDPVKYFSLEKTHTEILTTMGTDGKLKIFNTVSSLISYFCDYRTTKFSDKIEYDKAKLVDEINFLTDKKKFIKAVVMNKIDFRKVTKEILLSYVFDNITQKDYGKSFVRIPLYECTVNGVEELISKIDSLNNEMLLLQSLNGKDLFNSTLAALKL